MERIQRKGFFGKLPTNTKAVHRPSKWGNPFKVGEVGRAAALEMYKAYILKKLEDGELNISELKGKNLACFCSLEEDCHADFLLKLANT